MADAAADFTASVVPDGRARIELFTGAVLLIRRATEQELEDAGRDVSLAIERALAPTPAPDAIWELVKIDANFRIPPEITGDWASAEVRRLVLIRLATECAEFSLNHIPGVSISAPNRQWIADLLSNGALAEVVRWALGITLNVNVKFSAPTVTH